MVGTDNDNTGNEVEEPSLCLAAKEKGEIKRLDVSLLEDRDGSDDASIERRLVGGA